MRLKRITALQLAASVLCSGASAHPLADPGPGDVAPAHALAWSFEPWVLASLAIAWWWYGLGLRRIRREGVRVGLGTPQAMAFVAGMASLFIALVSPIDTVGAELFSVHMVQHLLLMMVAAPLLVSSTPVTAFLWAFPPVQRKRIGRVWNALGLTRAVRFLTGPLVVWIAFSSAFVFWHIPASYQWALQSELVHTLEHLSFFVTALAFWTIVIEPSGRRRIGYGPTLLFVATTAVVNGLPGALMIFAPRPLYPAHAHGVAHWGLTLIQDQQLAGLIMWIPAGFVYLVAVCWLFLRWLQEEERQARAAVSGTGPLLACVLACFGPLAGCYDGWGEQTPGAVANAGGDAHRGAALIQKFGCGACHTIPGISGADGLVGPPLETIARRVYIAGVLPNSPDNLAAYIENPQQFVPGNVMPVMGISHDQARDIAAYLSKAR